MFVVNHRIRISSLLSSLVLVFLVSCQTAATPLLITPVPTATKTLQPTVIPSATATPQPIMTSLLTITPAPLCGNVAPPTITTAKDIFQKVAKYEPRDGQVYFGFTYRLGD